MVVLRALGRSEIDTGITTLTPSQEVVFAAALYLILEGGRRVSRTLLASLLWPQVPVQARAHRLRQTILQLKKLGMAVVADRNTLHFAFDQAENDVRGLVTMDTAALLEHTSLQFLPGYSPRLSEAFRDWIETKRSEVHAVATSILVRELERSRLQADWRGAEIIASKCLTLDPYNEAAVLAQAEASAMRGGKRQAVSILDRYIAEVGVTQSDLHLPATLLRRRVIERVPDRPALLNTAPPFVGREVETEALTRKFNAARRGKGSAVLLVGEPGIGKSRLSSEVAAFAELQGAQVQRASCRRTDVDRPLSLFVDIVPRLRDMPGALGCAPESFVSLKRLTEFEDRRHDPSRDIDSETIFQNLRTALFDLFDSVAEERCLAVFVDDIHWLDEASAKILVSLVVNCSSKRLFFVFNSRPSSNSFLTYTEALQLETIALGPLKSTACVALLDSAALRPGDRLQADFVEWCLAVAEGNPFFLQELAHHWIETGQRYAAPPSIARILEERLSHLSGEALQVLQTCAVLGEHATLDRVEQILDYHPYQVLSAIEELSKTAMLGKITEGSDSTEGRLKPRHDFLAAAAINRLAPISLAFIHRRSADILEKEIAQAMMPATLLWACAGHRHHAGDRQRALALSLSCAEHLLSIGLAEDSCKAFEKSLEYCSSETQRLHVLPRLATAWQLNGKWDRSKEALRACISISSQIDPSAGSHNEFELRLFAARHQSALDFSLLLPDIVRCVEAAEALPAHRVRAAAMALRIATDFGPSDLLDSIYRHVEPLLNMKDVPETSRFEVETIYRTTREKKAIPADDLRVYAASARALGGELAYSGALLTAAAACRISGRYKEALAFLAEAMEHATLHNHRARLPLILVSEIRLHVAGLEYDRAGETLRRLMQCSIPADDDFLRSEVQTYLARLALEKGDVTTASAALGTARNIPESYSPRRRANSLALFLRVRLGEGAAADEIRSLTLQLEVEHFRLRGLGGHDFESYALFLGLCAIGEEQRGRNLLAEYVTVHRKQAWPLPSPIRTILCESSELGGDGWPELQSPLGQSAE
jgi:DNA-binding SARP family transcriptional activator/tetratricopeptide (TPR) repeat protein